MRTNATFQVQRAPELVRLQRDRIKFQSTLSTRQAEVVEGNRVILKTACRETRKADGYTEVTVLQRDKSDLQSALGALQREVAEGKQRLSPSIGDFKQWMRKSSVNSDTLVSDADPSTTSCDIHQVLAHSALLKLRSETWSSAYEDANEVILHSIVCVV